MKIRWERAAVPVNNDLRTEFLKQIATHPVHGEGRRPIASKDISFAETLPLVASIKLSDAGWFGTGCK